MPFSHRPATFACDALMLGLGGPSGSGKTLSALRVATGMSPDKPVFFIDTEKGRGLLYARKFKYEYVEMDEPYTPDRYLEAVRYCVAQGAGATIIDSGSHEHEGTGGVLEMQEQELKRMVPDGNYGRREAMKFTAWINPKAAHNRMVNGIIQLRHHMIWCFRAKDKLELIPVEDEQGRKKIKPQKAGWTPICTDRFEYEMTAMLVLPPGAKGRPDLAERSTKISDELMEIFHDSEQLTEEHGRQLARWAQKEQEARGSGTTTNGTAKPKFVDWLATISELMASAESLLQVEAVEARDDVINTLAKGNEKQKAATLDVIAAARGKFPAKLPDAPPDDEITIPGEEYANA